MCATCARVSVGNFYLLWRLKIIGLKWNIERRSSCYDSFFYLQSFFVITRNNLRASHTNTTITL